MGESLLTVVPRRACSSAAEQAAGKGVGAVLLRLRRRRKESEWEGRERAGVLHFKLASARRGQAKPGAWRPRGGNLLATVGHDRPEFFDSGYYSTD